MVELSTQPHSKRRKLSNQQRKSTLDSHKARYPLGFQFSALTYKQSPVSLCVSPQKGVLLSVPYSPNNSAAQVSVIAGDLFTSRHNKCIRKAAIKPIQEFHQQCLITHLEWNQKGNILASVDETGQLALWQLKSSIHDWSKVYSENLKQPLAAFLWLDSDRMYGLQADNSFKREPLKGPRNPYGQLEFVTITVHGEITVHYQRTGSIFSTITTSIPNIGRREISRVDAGCFGMSLAGLDDWERISHAAITLDKTTGTIYLASHNASLQPNTVALHAIKIKFPGAASKASTGSSGSHQQGAIECRHITSLKPQKQKQFSHQDYYITQLTFRQNTTPVELVVGSGYEEITQESYTSFISSWQLTERQQIINTNFGTVDNTYKSFICKSGIKRAGHYISSLKTNSHGNVIVGYSDGSIYIEPASPPSALDMGADNTEVVSVDKHYEKVLDPQKTTDGYYDPIADVTLSTNETHLLYMYSSAAMGITRIKNDAFADADITSLCQKLQLCLLNNKDYLDLISELVRMSKQHTLKDEEIHDIVNKVLVSYEIHHNSRNGDISADAILSENQPLQQWSLPQLQKAYGFAMAVYRHLPNNQTQYINLTKAIQLPVIIECFINSCVNNNYAEIEAIIDRPTFDEDLTESGIIEFDINSIWSLVSLSKWTLDYVKWTLRHWKLLFNCKMPKNAKTDTMMEKPNHAVLLLHQDSRILLRRILKLIHHFTQYINTTLMTTAAASGITTTTDSSSLAPNYPPLTQLPEPQSLLQRYTSTLTNDHTIDLKSTIDFLDALDDLNPTVTSSVENRWKILLSSTITSYTISDIQKIADEYKDKCAKPYIYIAKEVLQNSMPDRYDVIRKTYLPPISKSSALESEIYRCLRCGHCLMSTNPSAALMDPFYSSQWFQTLNNRCVCGGIFF